jgi:ATP-dependent Clp protease protease subunit
MARHTGQTVDQIEKDTDRDRFMSGEVAVKYGLIDTVLEQRAELPKAVKDNIE